MSERTYNEWQVDFLLAAMWAFGYYMGAMDNGAPQLGALTDAIGVGATTLTLFWLWRVIRKHWPSRPALGDAMTSRSDP